MGKNLGTIHLNKNTYQDNLITKSIKKMMAELGEIYARVGIVPENVQLMVKKLRVEFDKEKDGLVKKQADELKPVQEEFDKLTEKIKGYHTQLREMGRKHVEEQQTIAMKYIDLELKIIRPAIPATGKSPIEVK